MSAELARYDRIGGTYSHTRREDPRLSAAIRSALGDARSVVNVGAGTGSYEPAGATVIAIEPSARMTAQRRPSGAQVIQGTAEALPLADDSVDAALAVLTDHHWTDRRRGLAELRRVARKRVVLVNADPAAADAFWLTRDYLPKFHALIPRRYRHGHEWLDELREQLGPLTIQPLPIPRDCSDGFYQAYWRRPHAYLDDHVRRGISVFHRLDSGHVDEGLDRLRIHLDDGTWEHRNAHLLALDAADVGMRIIVAEQEAVTAASWCF